jgi:hypothetical protein
LVEHWNGTTWSIMSSPNRAGATDNELDGVSCTNDTNCYAAGGSIALPFRYTLLERYA